MLTKIEKPPLLYLSKLLGFKLSSWLLQCFGYIQSETEDAKSAVSIKIYLKRVIGSSPAIRHLWHCRVKQQITLILKFCMKNYRLISKKGNQEEQSFRASASSLSSISACLVYILTFFDSLT